MKTRNPMASIAALPLKPETRNPKLETPNRPGVALLMTMAAVAIAFVIGMTIIAGLPAASRASANLVDRQQAMYLAESGLQEAIARFNQPPPGQSVWSGVTNRSVTGLNGTYDVVITDLGSGQYRIDSTGRLTHSTGGATAINQNLHLVISLTTSQSTYLMPASTVMNSGPGFGIIPTKITYNGDVAVYGTAINLAHIKGNLQASGSILNFGRVEGTVQPFASIDAPPDLNLDTFTQYSYNGQTYQAQIVQPNDVKNLKKEFKPVTSGNPLGVVVVAGDMTLSDDLVIKGGILVVRGNLSPGGNTLEVQGQDSYFSLMVGGKLYYNNSTDLKVSNGPAYLKNTINPVGFSRNASMKFDAGLVSLKTLPLSFGGNIEINPINADNGDSGNNKNKGKGNDNKSSTGDGPVAINLLISGASGGGSGGGSGRTVQLVSYSASSQP